MDAGWLQVLVKVKLLRPLVTCCLVARTLLLPARGFAALSCPCSSACIGSQPPVGTETSAHPPRPCWRRAVRLLGLCEEPGTQGTCDYFKAGDRPSPGNTSYARGTGLAMGSAVGRSCSVLLGLGREPPT